MFKLFTFICLGFSFNVFAIAPKNIEFESLWENYFALDSRSWEFNDLTSDNRNTEISSGDLSVDSRPELKLTVNKKDKFVLRARWIGAVHKYEFKSPTEEKYSTVGKIDLTDFFWERAWGQKIRSVVGLQVYQWGPAELMNPSDPLFHFNFQQKTPFYKEKGQVLLRLNVDWSSWFNQILLVEPISNNEAPWIAGEQFSSKGLLKNEIQFSNPSDYLGVSFGIEEKQKAFFGEYFSYSPVDGISFYMDGKQVQDGQSFYPAADNLGAIQLKEQPDDGGFESLIISGFRYETSWLDGRLEYVYNEAGLNSKDWQQWVQSVRTLSTYILDNTNRFQNSGRELPGQHYAYVSLRFPNLGKGENISIASRTLFSMIDGSWATDLVYEHNLSDSWVGYLQYQRNDGPAYGELSLNRQELFLIGAKSTL